MKGPRVHAHAQAQNTELKMINSHLNIMKKPGAPRQQNDYFRGVIRCIFELVENRGGWIQKYVLRRRQIPKTKKNTKPSEIQWLNDFPDHQA